MGGVLIIEMQMLTLMKVTIPVHQWASNTEKYEASNHLFLDLSTRDKDMNSQFTHCNVSKRM